MKEVLAAQPAYDYMVVIDGQPYICIYIYIYI